jgi:nucleotide-binding universal stress UspA family protein
MITPIARSILVATDLSSASDDVVASAATLAGAAGATLHLLHSYDFQALPYLEENRPWIDFQGLIEGLQRSMEGQVERCVPEGVRVGSQHIVVGPAHQAILETAGATAADLIVLGPHRELPFGDHILGGTADRVIRTAEVPCLVVRRPLRLPVERMVVPLDLSEPARVALDLALGWSRALSAESPIGMTRGEVRVVHVIPRAFEMKDFSFDSAVIGPEVDREIAAALERVAGSADLEVLQEVMWGDSPAREIVRYAERHSTDLLVLGTHGYGAVRRALIGSVASTVARRAHCSVLLVPPALWHHREEDQVAATSATIA